MPIEQSMGNPRYNSDIYALGTIAQLAVTGLSPNELIASKNNKSEIPGETRQLVHQP